jgi:hypothetical protein
MERRHPSLPLDLVHTILRTTKDFDGNAIFPPCHSKSSYNTYLNRYARFALQARCVCRVWRDIVDMRSSYWFRVSAGRIVLHLGDERDWNVDGGTRFRATLSGVSGIYSDFRDAVSHSDTSMLVLDFHVSAALCPSILDLAPLEAEAISPIEIFFLEVNRIKSYENRLLQLGLFAPGDSGLLHDFPFQAVRSLSAKSVLRRLELGFASEHEISIVNLHVLPEVSRIPVLGLTTPWPGERIHLNELALAYAWPMAEDARVPGGTLEFRTKTVPNCSSDGSEQFGTLRVKILGKNN